MFFHTTCLYGVKSVVLGTVAGRPKASGYIYICLVYCFVISPGGPKRAQNSKRTHYKNKGTKLKTKKRTRETETKQKNNKKHEHGILKKHLNNATFNWMTHILIYLDMCWYILIKITQYVGKVPIKWNKLVIHDLNCLFLNYWLF